MEILTGYQGKKMTGFFALTLKKGLILRFMTCLSVILCKKTRESGVK